MVEHRSTLKDEKLNIFANSFYGTLHQTHFFYPPSSQFSLATDLSNTSGEDQKFEDDTIREP